MYTVHALFIILHGHRYPTQQRQVVEARTQLSFAGEVFE